MQVSMNSTCHLAFKILSLGIVIMMVQTYQIQIQMCNQIVLVMQTCDCIFGIFHLYHGVTEIIKYLHVYIYKFIFIILNCFLSYG